MPATATAPASVQVLPGRPRRRGHVGLSGLARMSGPSGLGAFVLVVGLVVLTMASPLDRAGRGAHAAAQLSASASAAHTHTTLATLTQAPTALQDSTPSSQANSASPGVAPTGEGTTLSADAAAAHVLTPSPAGATDDAAASSTIGQQAPSGHSGDHHHHVDLDPMSTGAPLSTPTPAFAPAPIQLVSQLLVASVTLAYPD